VSGHNDAWIVAMAAPGKTDYPAAAIPAYRLVRSQRRTVSLMVGTDGDVEVRCPLNYPRSRIDHFVREKADWIARKQKESQAIIPVCPPTGSQAEAWDLKIKQRLAVVIRQYPVEKPGRIMIRNQVSRWGSCSSKRTIAINRCCGILPPALIDYVILHEFCHLVYMNHNTEFWRLLTGYLPDARNRRQALAGYRLCKPAGIKPALKWNNQQTEAKQFDWYTE